MNLIPATSLTDDDAAFLDQAATLFPCNLPFAVLSGSHVEINTVVNKYAGTAYANPKYHDAMSHYSGQLYDITKVAVHAYVLKQVAEPMTAKDRLYAVWGDNKQVRYTKLYAQYFSH